MMDHKQFEFSEEKSDSYINLNEKTEEVRVVKKNYVSYVENVEIQSDSSHQSHQCTRGSAKRGPDDPRFKGEWVAVKFQDDGITNSIAEYSIMRCVPTTVIVNTSLMY